MKELLELELELKKTQKDVILRYTKLQETIVAITNFRDKEIFLEAVKKYILNNKIFNIAFVFKDTQEGILIKNFELKRNQLERKELENKSDLRKELLEFLLFFKEQLKEDSITFEPVRFLDNTNERLKEIIELRIKDEKVEFTDGNGFVCELESLMLNSNDYLKILDALLKVVKNK